MKLTKWENIVNILLFVVVLFVFFVVGFQNTIVSVGLFLVLGAWTIYLSRIQNIRLEKERKQNQEKADEYKKRIY